MQGGELIIIAIIALIVLGPQRLPDVARKLGSWTAELRKAAREIKRGLEQEVAEIKAPLDEVKKPLREIRGDLRDADPRKFEWTGPKPVSGPTPEDAMADLEKIEGDSDPDAEASE
ncbi:MAG: Sec-independent protein translocase protein TatB [Acidimicrobiia bacterium]|nr:Sec-independent protein translocase protein TatB [Acidimicrobiia bacterium]